MLEKPERRSEMAKITRRSYRDEYFACDEMRIDCCNAPNINSPQAPNNNGAPEGETPDALDPGRRDESGAMLLLRV
jgi:hypothetical protein